jgi:hypothetical protein
VRISTPASSVAGAPCRVKVSVSRAVSAAVLLQERSGRRWRTVARKRLTRRSTTLRCPAARSARTRRFRAVVRRGDRILARSPVVVTRVTPKPVAIQPPTPAPPTPMPPRGRRPIDPAQFGVEGTGGPPSPETLALLGTSRVALSAVGVADLQAGRIDPRIVAVLTKLAEAHALTVGAMCSDHHRPRHAGQHPHRVQAADRPVLDAAGHVSSSATSLGSCASSARRERMSSAQAAAAAPDSAAPTHRASWKPST